MIVVTIRVSQVELYTHAQLFMFVKRIITVQIKQLHGCKYTLQCTTAYLFFLSFIWFYWYQYNRIKDK